MFLKKIKTDFFVIVDTASSIRMNDYYLDDVGSICKCVIVDSRYWTERTQYKQERAARINYSTSPLGNCKSISLQEVKELIGEDNKDKKYTEEDLRKAFFGGGDFKDIEQFDFFIKSLQPKTEWEVEIVDGKLKLK